MNAITEILQHDLLAEIGVLPDNALKSTEDAHVMIIDDEPINIKLVRKVLGEIGFSHFTGVTNSCDAMVEIRRGLPDLLLLDIMMPHVDGLEILEAVKATPDLKNIPVLVLTASSDRATKLEALELGALDFLAKPVDRMELIPRVRNALAVKRYQDQLRCQNDALEQEVERRNQELELSRVEVVHCLGRAAEFHDDVTGRHVVRVGLYAGLTARAMGMNDAQVKMIELAAQLHDIGKIGIPRDILGKQGQLTAEEFSVIQGHCMIGKEMFERMSETQSRFYRTHPARGQRLLEGQSPLIQMASRIALTHHEHFDGRGYPLGLSGEDIPMEGRITAVADVFDALSCRRPYKPAFSLDECFEIMEEGRNSQFDPEVLDAFLSQREAIVKVRIEYADLALKSKSGV